MFKNALQPSKKKEKEGLGGSQHSLARTEATEKWAAFYFNSLLAHPTLALLVVSQRGPHSHFSTLLCSLFFVFVFKSPVHKAYYNGENVLYFKKINFC